MGGQDRAAESVSLVHRGDAWRPPPMYWSGRREAVSDVGGARATPSNPVPSQTPVSRPQYRYAVGVTTRAALLRWRSILSDIEKYGSQARGRVVRAQLAGLDARANVAAVNATPVYRIVVGILTTPFSDLWAVDAPKDAALVAVLQPVHDAALAFTTSKELLPQWDRFENLARQALSALDVDAMSVPTAEEIIADMLLSLKTTLLLAGTGLHGAMKVVAEELIRRQVSFATPVTAPLRFYDLTTNTMVEYSSKTTLSLQGLKAIVTVDGENATQSAPAPAVMKQFAAQVIVNFYTDWEEYYRGELARIHRCDKHDFQIQYFGDLAKIRHDYVHNRGVCRNSARCKKLRWFVRGQMMVPTAANYLQLITEFPDDELAASPVPVQTGRTNVNGQVDLAVTREFEKCATDLRGSIGAALDEALSEWIVKHRPTEQL